jgi:hypothetical protein
MEKDNNLLDNSLRWVVYIALFDAGIFPIEKFVKLTSPENFKFFAIFFTFVGIIEVFILSKLLFSFIKALITEEDKLYRLNNENEIDNKITSEKPLKPQKKEQESNDLDLKDIPSPEKFRRKIWRKLF